MGLRDLLAVLFAYLLGSIPFAYLITRRRTGLDIREVGEGNVGGRNVWHVVGPSWGTIVSLLDGMKGMGAVMFTRDVLHVSPAAAFLAGPAAIVGHGFPVFLRFRGGKGVASTIGVVMAWMPEAAVGGLALFGLSQLFLRDFNKSIVVGVATMLILPRLFGYPWPMVFYAGGLFLCLALKKWLDAPHERRVWARAGWRDGARPGFYREETPEETEPRESPDPPAAAEHA
ncbi:MAG: glycerol-3-phosphate acyltransferase [Chloroflexia bacterium]